MSSLSSAEGEENGGHDHYLGGGGGGGGVGDLLSMGWNVCGCVSLEYGHVCISRAALNLFLQVSTCPAPSLLQVSVQMPYLKLHCWWEGLAGRVGKCRERGRWTSGGLLS